jgi:hypothetical protein
MHFQGDYPARGLSDEPVNSGDLSWGCSLFAASGDPNHLLYGRNFDWEHAPALLLFTHAQKDRYASVSMVDLTFIIDDERKIARLDELVGMAAVPDGGMRVDPRKPTKGSIGIIREMLDRAASLDEALALFDRYNIDMAGGPPIHYLIADAQGRSALVEFYQGKKVVTPNMEPWHLATNFIRASVDGPASGQCYRYDILANELKASGGKLTPRQGMDLLSEVAQNNTQWSVVYEQNTGMVRVVMGRQNTNEYVFQLKQESP